jgi:MFS family permease
MASPARLLTPRFVLVVLVGLLYFLSLGTLLPVVPVFVERELHGGSIAVGITVGAFFVGAVLLRPFAGLIGDRAGRKVLVVGGALTAGLATGLYHLATSVVMLVLARFLGGLGEAGFFVGAAAMVADLAPEERRGEAISYWSVAVYGGLAFGPVLGEWALHASEYGTVWTLSAALALGAGVLALATKETMQPRAEHDGARSSRPVLLHRAALPPGAVLFLGLIAVAGFVEFVPLYVDDIGLDESRTVFLVYGCVILAVRIFGARIPDRAGPLLAGSGATAGVAIGMTVLAVVDDPVGLYVGTVVFAIGMSLLYPAMLTLTLSGVSETERGSAVGTVSSFFDLSQGLGAVMLGGVATVAGIRGAFAASAVAAVAGLVLLRSGVDPRTRQPVDEQAAEAARESVEPDPV